MSVKKRKLLEALLFASDGVVDRVRVKKHLSLNDSQLDALLEELQQFYDSSNSGFKVVSEGGLISLQVRDELIPTVKGFMEAEFSSAVLKTLAMISFKSPVKQSEIVKSRGNKAYKHIEELIKRGFVISESKSRTKLLRLTPKFFQYFNIDEKSFKKRFKK